MKTKTFDCVEMKRQVQQELLAEYEARKGEFASFDDYLRHVAESSEWGRAMRRRFSKRDQPHGAAS